MGWASGSSLFYDIWKTVRPLVYTGEERLEICIKLMRAFENNDWDTQDECFIKEWPEVEKAFYLLHPECINEV